MINATENLNTMNIKDVNNTARALWDKYRDDRSKINLHEDKSIEAAKKWAALAGLTSAIAPFMTCSRRSQKMKLDLESAISRAEDAGVKVY